MPPHRLTSETIEDEAGLRALIGEPAPLTCAKVVDYLSPLTRQLIERAPFLCLATSDEQGNCDVTPRGDPTGFVRILDDKTLLIRVNGRATLTTDAALLEPCAVEGKQPKLGILVDIEEAYTHCSKAFIRSQLWDPTRFVDRAELPTNGELLKEIQGEGFDADDHDAKRAERYARRQGFY